MAQAARRVRVARPREAVRLAPAAHRDVAPAVQEVARAVQEPARAVPWREVRREAAAQPARAAARRVEAADRARGETTAGRETRRMPRRATGGGLEADG